MGSKTGTAQSGPGGELNGTFVAFAPYDDPQIALAVVIEHAKHGGDSAGVVAREVLAQYFNLPDILNKPFNGVSVE